MPRNLMSTHALGDTDEGRLDVGRGGAVTFAAAGLGDGTCDGDCISVLQATTS